MFRKAWTTNEEDILRENYQAPDRKRLLSLLPGRTFNQIASKAHHLGLSDGRQWTDEENKLLVENYDQLGPKGIGKLLPFRSRNAIVGRARVLGLYYEKENIWTVEEEAIIRENYQRLKASGLETLLPGRSNGAIKHKAIRLGLSELKENIVNTYNPSFFSEVNPLSAYWAGFIAADGSINEKKQNVTIAITIFDKAHLEAFAADTQYDGKVHIRKRSTGYSGNDLAQVTVASASWVADLNKNFAITPRKSMTLEPPRNLAGVDALAYIIGYLDGDGCIHYGKQTVSGKQYPVTAVVFVGTQSSLEWMKEIFDRLVPEGRKPVNVRPAPKGIFRYHLSGKRAQAILAILKAVDCPHLPRKWDKVRPDGSIDDLVYNKSNDE